VVIHVLFIGAAFLLVTVPVAEQMRRPADDHISLVLPFVPHPHKTIEPPRVRHMVKLALPAPVPVVKPPVEVAKVIPPPVVPKPVIVQPKPEPKIQPRIEAESRPAAPAPKPALLLEAQAAKAPAALKPVVVGGFGDPRGVQNSETPRTQPVLMAKVGAFDNPNGAGPSGGGGRLDSGSVKQSGFGNASVANGSAGGSGKAALVQTGNFGDSASATRSNGGTVHTGGFGDSVAAAPQHRTTATAAVAAFTPVEILFKPRPSYSAEARGMHLEGQVSMEVVFQASGTVKVVRVIKGLGHGLDEAAEQAALQVRFKPATRSGAAVDTSATISITFELS
jgi:TonB family protein